MPTHHPGSVVHNKNIDLTDVPWALTTHLLSINHDQLLRTTRHTFLDHAAKGTLPKPLLEQWLANDSLYLHGYLQVIKSLLNTVKQTSRADPVAGVEPTIEARLHRWLEGAVTNGEREARFFQEVAEIYKFNLPSSLPEESKSEGLRRFEKLFSTVATQQPQAYIPWLEGTVLLWATEKVYFEAWSYARRQDAQSSPKSYENDADGGAMRRELIPNWSNRDFMMFVEELERILNEGVSDAVGRDDAKWRETKSRTDAIWQAVLDAEEAFWPDMPGAGVGAGTGTGTSTGASAEAGGELREAVAGGTDVKVVHGHIPLQV